MGKPAQIKTKQNEASVDDFIAGLADDQQRKDSVALVKLMAKVSGEKPKMWGSSMIGFGSMRYKSPNTGREVDWFKIGFAPRKSNLSLHLVSNVQDMAADLEKLGKHKTGSGCVYVNKLEDVDLKVLEKMVRAALKTKEI